MKLAILSLLVLCIAAVHSFPEYREARDMPNAVYAMNDVEVQPRVARHISAYGGFRKRHRDTDSGK
uniref:Venom peptide Ld6a n=1 Tax=Lethocerus distinctifemur TaxID=280095 RepID=A0A2K8JLJ2_9HEMI|nr:venom peptide Ld6a [Lethocerus distinctifemur]